MSCSMSSGTSPWASVRIVTVGRVRSGRTSMGRASVVIVPIAATTSAATTTKMRLRSEKRMIWFSMVARYGP